MKCNFGLMNFKCLIMNKYNYKKIIIDFLIISCYDHKNIPFYFLKNIFRAEKLIVKNKHFRIFFISCYGPKFAYFKNLYKPHFELRPIFFYFFQVVTRKNIFKNYLHFMTRNASCYELRSTRKLM